MSPRLCCVLRSGGEYDRWHVMRLRDQLADQPGGRRLLCLTDVGPIEGVETLPLERSWPGWWSKMELFRPSIDGDLLYMDLDSSIVGDLSDMASIGRTTIMRDVYRPAGLQSSVMYLAEADRGAVWRGWLADPGLWMRQHQRGGDQAFLERVWRHRQVALWQEQLPGQVVSFKVDVRGRGIPRGARFVAFHGQPRPWDVGW